MELFAPAELARIESEFARGISAGAIVEIFRPKGVRLSEATFRKYVQAGLRPRSRRVGRKGKHRGSHGVYPVASVRRINAIKKMMAAGLTLEDIRRSFVGVKNHIDQVERSLDETLAGLESELSERTLANEEKRSLQGELSGLRRRAGDLVRDLSRVGSALTAQRAVGSIERRDLT